MDLFGTLRAPRELVFGSGQRNALGPIARGIGTRALIITDSRLASDALFLEMVAGIKTAGVTVSTDSTTLPDVPVDSAIESAERARLYPRHGDRHRGWLLPGHGQMRRGAADSWRATAGLLRRV